MSGQAVRWTCSLSLPGCDRGEGEPVPEVCSCGQPIESERGDWAVYNLLGRNDETGFYGDGASRWASLYGHAFEVVRWVPLGGEPRSPSDHLPLHAE